MTVSSQNPIDWLRVVGFAVGIIILLLGALLTLYLGAIWVYGAINGDWFGASLVAITSLLIIPSLAVAWCGWLITRRCWDKDEVRPKFRRVRK